MCNNMNSIKRSDYISKQKSYGLVKKPRKSGRRKKANGKGTIEKSNNNLNPYKVKVPVGTYTDKNGKTQVRYKSLGYYPSKGIAEEALAEYNRTPYDLTNSIETFSDLYKAWSKEYFEKYTNESSIRTIRSAYAYCGGLYYMKIRQIAAGHIKDAMNHGYIIQTKGKHKGERKYASLGTRERIKSICNLMFDYAVEHNLMISNPARTFKINDLLDEIEAKAKKKKPFSLDDVAKLWEYREVLSLVDIILVGIYSGFRPRELILLRIENIFLEKRYMIGGMKTVNGRDRVVPIHPAITEIIKFHYSQATDHYHSDFLFNHSCGNGSRPFSYDTYNYRFQKVMSILNLKGFTPHCTRHTFATRAEECGMREWAMKLIMGHSLCGDVTDMHYKHTGIDYLYREICKITFDGGKKKM